MELRYFVMLLASLSITLLYILSTFTHPVAITFKEIAEYDGKQVILSGFVSEHYLTTYESQIIIIRDKTNQSDEEITLFVEKPADIEYGDYIQATGTIQQYENTWELVISHPKNIKIISPWINNTYPIWQLAEQPQKYVGLNVRTHGIVDRTYDTYFYIVDSSGRYTLAIYYTPQNNHTVLEGSTRTVDGRFLYDSETLRYVVDARDQQTLREMGR